MKLKQNMRTDRRLMAESNSDIWIIQNVLIVVSCACLMSIFTLNKTLIKRISTCSSGQIRSLKYLLWYRITKGTSKAALLTPATAALQSRHCPGATGRHTAALADPSVLHRCSQKFWIRDRVLLRLSQNCKYGTFTPLDSPSIQMLYTTVDTTMYFIRLLSLMIYLMTIQIF